MKQPVVDDKKYKGWEMSLKKLALLATAAVLAATLMATNANAEEMLYVGDRLSLGMHQSPKMNSPIDHIIKTGDKVKVIARSGNFAKVETSKGQSGWVQSSFLSTKPPADKQVVFLQNKLNNSEKSFLELEKKTDTLASQLSTINKSLTDKNEKINQLEKDNARLTKIVSKEEPMVPESDLEELKQESAKQVAELEAEINRIKEETQNLTRDQIDKMQQQQFELDKRLQIIQQIANGKSLEDLAPIDDQGLIDRGMMVLSFIMLILGFAVGVFWFDRHNRMKHGGYRV